MAGVHLATRRRLVARLARPMQLRRLTPAKTVTIRGVATAYRPQELSGGVEQGDLHVELLEEDLAAAGWTVPPANPDRLVVDGRTFTVQGARAVYDGAARIGWSLWVRGG